VEEVFDETISIDEKDKIVAIEYLPDSMTREQILHLNVFRY